MKIGYPCINRSIGCTANTTFRLKSYSDELLIEKVENNISCLMKILKWNLENGLLFFRISSDIVPFASHPVCKFNWQKHFSKEFREIGKFVMDNYMRISMHPDQFTLINALDKGIVDRSIKELEYHCNVLDALGLKQDAKAQIHVGGVYGDKDLAIFRFCEEYRKLRANVRKRLCIENDDRLFSSKDCMKVHDQVGIPVIFDSFHHECLNNGESIKAALSSASSTWEDKDGVLMCDYSSQKKGFRKGTHTEHINTRHFKSFLDSVKGIDLDIMLEIKDKEKSALKALKVVS